MAKSPILKGARAQAKIRAKQIARLRDYGLIKKSQGRTPKSRRAVLSKFRDVLTHRAAVVEVPTGKSARAYAAHGFKVKGRNVVVPRSKGERVRVEKSGVITTTRNVAGERVKRILYVDKKPPKPRKGKKFLFAVPFANGGRVRFDDLAALRQFMAPYSTYKNWRAYLEIEEVEAA